MHVCGCTVVHLRAPECVERFDDERVVHDVQEREGRRQPATRVLPDLRGRTRVRAYVRLRARSYVGARICAAVRSARTSEESLHMNGNFHDPICKNTNEQIQTIAARRTSRGGEAELDAQRVRRMAGAVRRVYRPWFAACRPLRMALCSPRYCRERSAHGTS